VTPQAVVANTLVVTSVPAGHVLKVLRISLSSTGFVDLLVTGDPSLRWFLFATTGSNWRTRINRLHEGPVGGAGIFVFLNAGTYALVVTGDGGVSTVDRPFTARLGTASTHLFIPGPGFSVGNIANGNYQFTATPQAGRWNAVGALGSFVAGYTIYMGNVSQLATSSTGFVVANGHLGPIVPTDGLLNYSSSLGQTGSLHQATIQTFNVGSSGTRNWTTSDLIHIFEFEIQNPGHYDLNVTGPNGLAWQTFTPGTSPTWRPRLASLT
jgi:hypothetical protein